MRNHHVLSFYGWIGAGHSAGAASGHVSGGGPNARSVDRITARAVTTLPTAPTIAPAPSGSARPRASALWRVMYRLTNQRTNVWLSGPSLPSGGVSARPWAPRVEPP